MELFDIPASQQPAILRALAYWLAHSDWECPTLFGLERSDFEGLLSEWPHCLVNDEYRAAVAIQGAFRELLLGASTPPPRALPELIGLTLADAMKLLESLRPRLQVAMRSVPASGV